MKRAILVAALVALPIAAWAWQPRSVGIAAGYALAPGQSADPGAIINDATGGILINDATGNQVVNN